MQKEKRTRKWTLRVLCLALTLLLVTGLGFSVLAEDSADDNTSAGTEVVQQAQQSPVVQQQSTNVVLASFAALPENVATQGFDVGAIAGTSGLVLPASLSATDADGNAVSVNSVSWDCAGFDPTVAGIYSFSATLPTGYTLGSGASAPAITVVMRDGEAAVFADGEVEELVRVTQLTSTTAGKFTSYNGNNSSKSSLTVVGQYSIVAEGGTTGTKVTIVLENAAQDYLAAYGKNGKFFDDATNITWPNDSTERTVDASGDDIVVSFVVAGGYGDSGNVTINYTFDAPNYGGWFVPGSTMANIAGAAEGQKIPARLAVISNTSDPRRMTAVKIPEGNTAVDVANTIKIGTVLANAVRWVYKPGTTFSVVMEYPAGAVVTDTAITGWTVTDDTENGILRWTLNATVGDDGGFSVYHSLSKTVQITFPGDEFSAGSAHVINSYMEYTLLGEDVARKTYIPAAIEFEIEVAAVHLQENVFTVSTSEEMPINVDFTAYMSVKNHVYNNITNGGSVPVPDVNLVWENDAGTNKAFVQRVAIYNVGYKIRFDVTVNGGVGGSRTVTKYYNSASNYIAVNLLTTVPLGDGEFIEKIECWPLDNDNDSTTALANNPALENRQLKVGCTFGGVFYYSSWPANGSGVHVFPNGTAIQHGDETAVSVRVHWKGESSPDLHTNPAATVSDGVYTIAPMPDAQKIVYKTNNPVPRVWFEKVAGQLGSVPPGTEVNFNLRFDNSGYYSGGDWKDPVLAFILPSTLELVTTDNLQVYQNVSAPVLQGPAVLSTTTRAGYTVYEIRMPDAITSVPMATSNVTASGFFVPMTLRVKDGTTAGTHSASSNAGSAFPATRGLVFGMTDYAGGMTITCPDIITHNYYYTDALNLDNNTNTPYLFVYGSNGIEVSAQQVMRVEADMYNNVEAEWQGLSNPDAMATVELNSTGQFRLAIVNQGNSYLGRIQLLNLLPQENDARGSEWTALLSGLDVAVLDADGNDKTSDFGTDFYTIRYSTQANPNYNGSSLKVTDGTDDSFSTSGANIGNAKSFVFELKEGVRLPGGYRIVITGTILAPSGATPDQVGTSAFNQFSAGATFYTAATGGTATVAPQFGPPAQEFVLLDAGSAVLEKSGFVFKDLNHDGVYTDGVDAKYAGATVQLYAEDIGNPGNPVATTAYSTTTDANGQYEFTNLPAGTYFIKVTAPSGSAYSFVAQGSGTEASHVDPATGFSGSFVLNAGASMNAPVNAGIQAASSLTVEFREGSSTGTLLKTVTVAYDDATYSAYASPLEILNGSVTAGTAPFTLPVDYHLQDTDPGADTQTYALTWSTPSQTIVFVVVKDTYTLSYVLNGSTDYPTTPLAIENEDVAWDSKIAQATNYVAAPTRNGYTFDGWYTASDFAAASKVDANTVMPKAATTLYAKWVVASYTISYNYAGGTAPATANPTGYTVEDLPVAIENEPTRDGYEFAGWTGSNGTTAALTVDLDTGDYGNKSYTANWTAIDYTISYDYAEGTAPATANPTSYTVEDLPVSIANEPTKAGYDFAGWTGSNGTTAQTTVTLAAGDFGNKSYVANWTATEYAVSFDGNGADGGSMSDIAVAYLTSATLPANTYTRTNYSFEGWATTAGGAVEYADGASYTQTETNDVTLYAVWKLSVFTVRFEDGDGNLIKEEQVNSGDSATPPTPPERYGYIFKGWNGNYTNVQKDELVVAIYQRDTDILPETVTVTFDYNDGRGTYTSVTVSFGDGQNNGLGANMPANPSGSSVFNGWNRSPDGNGAGFTASTSVTSNITVYAQWGGSVSSGSTPVSSSSSPSSTTNGTISVDTSAPVSVSSDSSSPVNSASDGIINRQTGNFFTDIGNGSVPLAHFASGVWSLLNLLMAVAALAMTLVLVVRGFGKRNANAGEEMDEEFEGAQGRSRWNLPRVFAVICGLLPGVLFLLLDNMSQPFAWINRYTPVIALVFVLHIALVFVQRSFGKRQRPEDDGWNDGGEFSAPARSKTTK